MESRSKTLNSLVEQIALKTVSDLLYALLETLVRER